MRCKAAILISVSVPALALSNPALAQDTAVETIRQTPTAVEAPPNRSEVQTGEEILVVGTRASLQSAIARKKNAGTVVDSIVADDIASFPDKNVGEALGRVTGVQLSRDLGEGVQVSIRGVEPDLNRVEINGVSQQSAAGERAGDFRELAVELVKTIDVYKGYTVDLTEGGIGGTVRVETRRPLELREPVFNVKAEAQRLNLAGGWRPRLNLLAGRSDLLDGRLGVIFNVTHNDVRTRGEYVANTNWTRLADFDRSASKTIANPAYANFGTYESCGGATGATAAAATTARLACETQFFDWAPSIVRYRTQDRIDRRTSIDMQLQYAFAKNFNVWGQAQLNYRNNRLQDLNYSANFQDVNRFNLDAPLPAGASGGTSRARPTVGTFTVDAENHILTSWTSALNGTSTTTNGVTTLNGANNNVGIQRRNFAYKSSSRYLQTGFNWELDDMQMVFLASRSSAKRLNETNLVGLSTSVPGIVIDRRNEAGLPQISFPTGFDPGDIASFSSFNRRGANGQLLAQNGPSLQYRPAQNDAAEDQLKLDIDYKLDWGPLKSIEYGGQYRNQDLTTYGAGGARLLRPAVTAVPAAGIVASPAVFQYNSNVSYTTVIGAPPTTGPAANTYYLSQTQFQQLLQSVGSATNSDALFKGISGVTGAPAAIAYPEFDFAGLSQYYDLSNFNQDRVRFADGLPQIPAYIVNEKVSAAYLKFNFGTDLFGMSLSGNAGIRYTHTSIDTFGSNTRRENRVRPGTGVNGIPAVIETATVGVQEARLRSNYTDWLPAVNVALEVRPNLVVRATYAKNLARPKPEDLQPSINCVIDTADTIAGDDTCTAGNPYLQPYRADQYDLNAAWYPNRDTLVSVGYYYKNIGSFVLPAQTIAGVDLFRDGVLYTVRQPLNGFGAKLDGVEVSAQTVFSFLPAPFDGLGVTGNFTYARAIDSGLTNQATGAAIDGFPGLSKFTYNASVFYDKDWLNVRFNYNRRSSWLSQSVNVDNSSNPIFRRGETFVDGKILFRLSPRYSIWAEALNLTNEIRRDYIPGLGPIEYGDIGRRVFLGMQLKI